MSNIELTTAPFLGDTIPAYLIDDTIYYIWDNLDWDTINRISSKYIKNVNPHTLEVYTTIPTTDYYTAISWIGLVQNWKPKGWDLDTAVICRLVNNEYIPLTEEELKSVSKDDLDNLYLELLTIPISESYRKETDRVLRKAQDKTLQ